jgi:hypothetical protein
MNTPPNSLTESVYLILKEDHPWIFDIDEDYDLDGHWSASVQAVISDTKELSEEEAVSEVEKLWNEFIDRALPNHPHFSIPEDFYFSRDEDLYFVSWNIPVPEWWDSENPPFTENIRWSN